MPISQCLHWIKYFAPDLYSTRIFLNYSVKTDGNFRIPKEIREEELNLFLIVMPKSVLWPLT